MFFKLNYKEMNPNLLIAHIKILRILKKRIFIIYMEAFTRTYSRKSKILKLNAAMRLSHEEIVHWTGCMLTLGRSNTLRFWD